MTARQKSWVLGPEAFEELLGVLDADRERAGQKYEAIRRSLVRIFEWRGCAGCEALADRTIDRVSRRVSEGERIRAEDPAVYFYGVARNVLKEYWTEEQKEASAQTLESGERPLVEDLEDIELRKRLECLDRCLAKLPGHSLDLIIRYYRFERGEKIAERVGLAEDLSVTAGTLRIRAHRIRRVLEQCVTQCMEQRAERWPG